MATEPYRETPTTEPVATPTPYQSLRTPTATAASFGGALGEAEQAAGRELSTTAAHWGEIAADDASNNFQKQADRLLRGDPDKMITNPDGTQTPDTGFMGLKGGEALRQRGNYEKNLDSLLEKTRNGLYSADQRLRFDNFSRRYRAVISSQMGTHADTQANAFAMNTHKGEAELALNGVTFNADNPELVAHYSEDVVNAYVKMAQQAGAQVGDAQYQAAVADGKRAAAHAQVTAIGVKDPARAARMVDNYKGILGKDYAPLADHYRTRSEEEGGAATGQQIYGESSDAAPGTPGGATVGHLNEETTSVLGNIQGKLKEQGIDVQPSSTYRDPAHNAQVGGRQASRHTTGQAFDLPTAGKSQQQLEQMFDAIAGQAGVSQIGWVGYHFHVGTGQRGKGKIAFGPNKNDLAGAPDWFVQKVKAWQGTPTGGNATTPGDGTHLSEEDEAKYQAWAKDKSASRGFNVDTPDYDMRGYWKEHGQGKTPEGDEHYPDTFKLPNHPTFSTESKYSTAANPGGQWVQGANGQQMFIAGPANVANGIDKTRQYLANNDPNVQLVVPARLQKDEAPAAPQGTPVEDPPAVRAARRRAAAIEKIVQSDMAPRAKSAAIRTVNELATADQLKWAAEEKAQKDLANAGMDEYVKAMAPGQIVPPNIVQKITQDPRFNHAPHMRQQLLEIAKHQSGNDVQEATSAYGPGFWDLYKRASASPGDPAKLTDPTELLRHAGPGGDITLQGMDRLQRVIAESHKSVDSHSVEQAKAAQMTFAKGYLSFQDKEIDPFHKMKDPEGEAIFNSQFVPKYLAAYDKWMQAGKDPWEFLTKENTEKLFAGMRDKKKMSEAELRARGMEIMPAAKPVPPTPQGANPDSWRTIVGTAAPTYTDGKPILNWPKAVQFLQENPTPENIKQFDEKYGASGYTGQEIIESLKKPYGPQPPTPNVELERAQAARRHAPASPTANVAP